MSARAGEGVPVDERLVARTRPTQSDHPLRFLNVKWSLLEVALVPSASVALTVPLGVVTVTSTVPGVSAGDLAVIDVDELTLKLVASVEPNLTAVAPVRFLPVIFTFVSPAADPLFGISFVIVGTGASGGLRPRPRL